MLLEELVEQHRVDVLVAHGRDFTILVLHHEVGIHCGHLLGNQTVLGPAVLIGVVFEGHRLERQNGFAGLVHRLNVVFEAPGRRGDAHDVKLIDKYCFLGANVANRLIEDAADEAGVIEGSKRTCTRYVDRDAVIDACPQTGAGLVTDSDVIITVYVGIECVITDRCVKGPCRVEEHGVIAHRIILAAGTVQERVAPMRVIEESADIVKQRECTDCVVIRSIAII